MPTSSETPHNRAMAALDDFESSKKAGLETAAESHLIEAYRLECEAARAVPVGRQPARSVLFRSAASIAFLCGLERDAMVLIAEGLRGSPPRALKAELLELLMNPPPRALPGSQSARQLWMAGTIERAFLRAEADDSDPGKERAATVLGHIMGDAGLSADAISAWILRLSATRVDGSEKVCTLDSA